MNERIKQLAEQAGFRSDVTVSDGQGNHITTKAQQSLNAFAELIIQECLDKISGLIVEETFENLEEIQPWLKWNQALGNAALDIEQHFFRVKDS